MDQKQFIFMGPTNSCFFSTKPCFGTGAGVEFIGGGTLAIPVTIGPVEVDELECFATLLIDGSSEICLPVFLQSSKSHPVNFSPSQPKLKILTLPFSDTSPRISQAL